MALEIFGLLTADGDDSQTDHIFTGAQKDVDGVGVVLDEVFVANRRLRSVVTLAKRFHEGARLLIPMVRLTKQECRVLVDNLDAFAKEKPKTSKARKLLDQLDKTLWVY